MRCYNGCPGPRLKALLDYQAKLRRKLLKLEPEACCTYFPVEEMWDAHVWGRSICKDMSNTLTEALEAAIKELES